MLHFFPPGMAERYLLFTFVAVLGTLQLIAARYQWVGLSLLGRQRRRSGYLLGAGLLFSAYVWFFGTSQPLIFQPGLAGTELFTVFAVSTLLATATTLGLVSLLHRSAGVQREANGKSVEFGPGRGLIHEEAGVRRGYAVVVVSDLPDGDFSISRLINELMEQDLLVLSIGLALDGPVEYPEVLARLPAACAYLKNQFALDGQGVVFIGAGIGGDLVLRAAAADPAVRGVTAIDPVLDPETTSLDLLHHSTFWEALRWGGLRRRLAEALAAAERIPQFENRSALLVYRTNPAPVGEIAADGVDVALARTDDEVVQRVIGWTTEAIARPKYVA